MGQCCSVRYRRPRNATPTPDLSPGKLRLYARWRQNRRQNAPPSPPTPDRPHRSTHRGADVARLAAGRTSQTPQHATVNPPVAQREFLTEATDPVKHTGATLEGSNGQRVQQPCSHHTAFACRTGLWGLKDGEEWQKARKGFVASWHDVAGSTWILIKTW